MRQEDGRVGVLDTALIGGVSGVVGWAVEIPFDNIKNRHQVITRNFCYKRSWLYNSIFRSVLADVQYHKQSTESSLKED